MIEETGFPPERATLIYNGVQWKYKSLSKRSLRNKYGFHKNDFIFIFVGRIDRLKGIYELIEAFKIFAKNSCNKKLIIAGKGEFNEALNRSKDLLNNILFTGHLSKEELSNFYKIADVGILPSYSEQSSFAVIEMIHNKIPLILSDIGGFKVFKSNEVIKIPIIKNNDSSGLDAEFLNSSLQLLYENKALRKSVLS